MAQLRAAGATEAEAIESLLQVELQSLLERGETLRRGDYLDRFPEHTARIDALIDAISPRFLDDRGTTSRLPISLQPSGDQPTCPAESPVAGDSEEADRETKFELLCVPGERTVDPTLRMGDYDLLEEIGVGGMGVVYRAWQRSLGRYVAVKIPLAGRRSTAAELEQFHDEARAAARLRHPLIVPVYEVGSHEGRPFYSMELIEGQTLASRLLDGPCPPDEAARLAMQIAGAIQYAHDLGVLHRDLKPANIVIDAQGNPHITDFGAARFIDSEMTLTGAVLGTPGYVAPERAALKPLRNGPATDVYSIGALLYALLTTRPPFQAPTPLETLRQVVERSPEPLRLNRPAIPRDLETICFKCLRKSPARRYPTAADLREDLARFLRGEPIQARPIGPIQRGLRWARRRPLLVGLATALCAMLILLALGFVRHVQEVEQLNASLSASNQQIAVNYERLQENNSRLAELNQELKYVAATAHRAEAQAAAQVRRSQMLLYASDVQQAAVDWQMGDTRNVLARLARHEPTPGQKDPRSFEWFYLRRLVDRPLQTLFEAPAPQYFLCPSPDRRTLASAGMDAVIRIAERASGQIVRHIVTGQGEINGLAYSADGRSLASTGDDGTVRVWDLASGTERMVAHASDQDVFHVAFALEDTVLVSCGKDPTIRIWEAATGSPIGSLEGHRGAVEAICLSADGKRVASAGRDGTARVWDIQRQELLVELPAVPSPVTCVDFSPGGNLLVSGSADGSFRIWSLPAGGFGAMSEGPDRLGCVAFSPDGRHLATGDWGGSIRLWTVDGSGQVSERPAQIWQAHQGIVTSLFWERDGRQLVSSGEDGRICISAVRPTAGEPNRDFADLSDLRDLVAIPGTNRFAVAGANGLRLWNADTGVTEAVLDNRPWHQVVIDKGQRLVTLHDNQQIAVWDLPSRTMRSDWSLSERVSTVGLSPDGSRIVAAQCRERNRDDDWFLRVYDLQGNAVTGALSLPNPCRLLHWSPNGVDLAAKSHNEVLLVDMERFAVRMAIPRQRKGLADLALSSTGEMLAIAGRDRTATLWDLSRGAQQDVLRGHHLPLKAIALTHDGQTVATAAEDGHIRLWSVSTGQPLCTLDERAGGCRRLIFSSNDRRLVSLNEWGVRVYDAEPVVAAASEATGE